MARREPLRYRALDELLGFGVIPDRVLRAGSRYGAWARLRKELAGGVERQEERLAALMQRMSTGPVAEATEAANEQHYELPADFFGIVLGPRRKYSGCLYPTGAEPLEEAEEAMLALYCERAGVRDGMEILDLGCGWGSVSLWLAEKYPNAKILGVCNSNGQREYIESVAAQKGFHNLEIETCDVNVFETERRFDRVISIEMFEHMRNWKELLRRISTWVKADGRLFVHVFSQRQVAYEFRGTWASARFFTEGRMPSHDLLLHFQDDMNVVDRWAVPGTHYARTLGHWLERLDDHREQSLAILARGRSERDARKLLAAWRLFFISTQEIWGWRGGNEWLVSHYLLEPRAK
jgi:cyclopropane-fatty-acyl-phospholipid synthase